LLVAFAAPKADPEAFARLGPHMSILGVKLKHDTLSDVQQRLGRAEVQHNRGDAAASASAVCYIGADGTVLAIISVSEMGGGRQMTSDFHLVRNASDAIYSPTYPDYVVPKEDRPKCSRLAALSKTTTTGGLRLGMTADQVRRKLGPPSRETASEIAYFASRDDPYEERSLKLQVLDGKVVGILAEAAPF
jgi:hypothetical protein